jgi:phenylacetate-CoA ligase
MRWHFGRDFDWAVSVTKEADNWSAETASAFQMRHVSDLLERAKSIEFYRQRGLEKNIFDLTPFNSAELREYSKSVELDDVRRYRAEYVATGGSTGEPVSFYLDRKGLALQKATRQAHARIVSKVVNPRTVQLRGIRYDPILPWDTKYAVKSFDGKTLYLNSYTFSRDTAQHFYDAWNSFKAETIFAYPSTLAEFVSLVHLDGVKLVPPSAIITSSETLLEEQRVLIERVLGAPIHDFYGLTECECIAIERGRDRTYQVDSHVCFVELLVGDRPAEEGEAAEVVITHLHNYAQPLIRYRTGDMAIGAVGGRLPNGSWRELTSIEGRVQEYLIAHDGARVTAVAQSIHADYWRGVVGLQFVQESPGNATMKLKVVEPLKESDLQLIKREITEKMQARVKVQFTQVARLYRTERGKTPRVVQADRVKNFDFG